jgi:hypothetical protein
MHKPTIEYVKPFASDLILAIGVVLGLFLLWLGTLISGWTTGDGDKIGATFFGLGMFFVTAVLFLGALLRTDMEKALRVILVVVAAALIIVVGYWHMF